MKYIFRRSSVWRRSWCSKRGANGNDWGEKPIFDRVNSAITAYAKNITLVGGPGKGQVAKMINQICIAGLIQALSEAISFSEKSGMDTKKVLQAISQGAAVVGS